MLHNLNDWFYNKKYASGTLDVVIGNVGEYKSELEFLKYRNNIKWKKFPPNISNINNLDPDISFRQDFTHLCIFSVDPNKCKDIDDALHITDIDDNNYEVGIHIADVTSYIPYISDLENIIANRCESVYLINEQINMLPNNMATNICSLIENEPRRTFSVIFTIDKNTLEIINTVFKKG